MSSIAQESRILHATRKARWERLYLEREDGDGSALSVLPSLGSSLTANAYPAGTSEFSIGELAMDHHGFSPHTPNQKPQGRFGPWGFSLERRGWR
jgi:hypothetical protein